MKYKERRRLYSQNFLYQPELVKKLIRKSSIDKKDVVLEIGPGMGIITSELARVAKKVIAIEIDENFIVKLRKRIYSDNTELVQKNFIDYELPKTPYKVFSNIPFSITADIVHKLTSDQNFQEGYLIVQKEAAEKFIGKPLDRRNQMIATLLKPWFDISVYHKFNRRDYFPIPKVDTFMIRIERLTDPLVSVERKRMYEDFVLYSYNKKKVSRFKFSKFLELFEAFLRQNDKKEMDNIKSAAGKLRHHQRNLVKIHRTRKNKNWRKF